MSEELRIQIFASGLLPPALLLMMLILVELGWRTGKIAFAKTEATKLPDDKTLTGAIFGLLALLIAFTFSGAASRFDGRRHLIVGEVRAVDSAHMALDLLPEALQPAIRQRFVSYVRLQLRHPAKARLVGDHRICDFDGGRGLRHSQHRIPADRQHQSE